MSNEKSPGWHKDPKNKDLLRWWDGQNWSGALKEQQNGDSGTEQLVENPVRVEAADDEANEQSKRVEGPGRTRGWGGLAALLVGFVLLCAMTGFLGEGAGEGLLLGLSAAFTIGVVGLVMVLTKPFMVRKGGKQAAGSTLAKGACWYVGGTLTSNGPENEVRSDDFNQRTPTQNLLNGTTDMGLMGLWIVKPGQIIFEASPSAQQKGIPGFVLTPDMVAETGDIAWGTGQVVETRLHNQVNLRLGVPRNTDGYKEAASRCGFVVNS